MMPRADGRPTINELVYGTNDPDEIAAIEAAQQAELDAERGWPESERCPGCDGHAERGPHRLSCHTRGRIVGPLSWIQKAMKGGE